MDIKLKCFIVKLDIQLFYCIVGYKAKVFYCKVGYTAIFFNVQLNIQLKCFVSIAGYTASVLLYDWIYS